jgi:hypothetical protein
MIKVKHVKEVKGEYIGRPSALGNPFKIGIDGSRSECIALYKRYLYKKIRDKDKAVISELHRLKKILQENKKLDLTCWCKDVNHPNRSCHGDVIKSILEYL